MKIVETNPGHLEITCDISQRPFVRSNENGMFCDAKICVCEQQSVQVSEELWGNFGHSIKVMADTMK